MALVFSHFHSFSDYHRPWEHSVLNLVFKPQFTDLAFLYQFTLAFYLLVPYCSSCRFQCAYIFAQRVATTKQTSYKIARIKSILLNDKPDQKLIVLAERTILYGPIQMSKVFI